MTRKVLGRGLEALISGDTATVASEGRPVVQAGVMEPKKTRILQVGGGFGVEKKRSTRLRGDCAHAFVS